MILSNVFFIHYWRKAYFLIICSSLIIVSCTRNINETIVPTNTLEVFVGVTSSLVLTETLIYTFVERTPSGITIDDLIDKNQSQAFFDFDAGNITNSEDADIYYSVGCGSSCYDGISAINGTKAVWIEGEAAPEYTGCKKAIADQNLLMQVSASKGDYSCLITNQNNLVQIHIIKYIGLGYDTKLIFEYVIWYE